MANPAQQAERAARAKRSLQRLKSLSFRQSVVPVGESVVGYVRSGTRYRFRGNIRPALTREDDPAFWDEHQAKLERWRADADSRRPENWTASKQKAMLMIQGSAFALDCIRHMHVSVNAGQTEFASLRNQGFAVKAIGDRRHTLTPAGIRTADECCTIVAKSLGLHHVTRDGSRGGTNRVTCSCGWHFFCSEKYGNTGLQIESAIARHLDEPDAWKLANERSDALIAKLFGTGGSDA